ncbi:MAG: hypothetical protein AB7L66_08860 [Gemmatimonadales bacterium]
MNRQLWKAVGGKVFVLGGVSFVTASRESLERAGAGAMAAAGWAERTLAGLSWPVIAGLAVGAVAIGALQTIRRRRPRSGFGEPWRTVIEMNRSGRNAAQIAQATGVSHDAVRIMLSPIAPDETRSPGKSFRSSSPGGSDRGPGTPPGRES